MKHINRLRVEKWLAENNEPVWRGQVVIGLNPNDSGNLKRAEQYKEWSIAHADWTRRLLKYLSIPSEY